MTSHLVIPDTQVKKGVSISHIRKCGELIVKRRPDVIVVLGDWWDYPSLGTHSDRGSIEYHNKFFMDDYEAGVKAFETLFKPLEEFNKKQIRDKKKKYKPRLVFTLGNHEVRRNRLESQQPKLLGALPKHEDYLISKGFEVYEYRVPVTIDGITYCHNCPQTKSAGSVERAHLIMCKRNSSWTVGHSQMLDYYVSPHEPRLQCIIAGAFYTHDESYKTGSNDHWRGLIYKHNVRDGTYDPEFISIDGLMRL